MKLLNKLEQIKKLENFETPWFFARIFGKVELFGNQICVTSNGDNDFVDVSEFKKAIEWLVSELGGKVVWQKPKADNE